MIRFIAPAWLAISLLALPVSAAEPKRPNLLFIFADDWGRFASPMANWTARAHPTMW